MKTNGTPDKRTAAASRTGDEKQNRAIHGQAGTGRANQGREWSRVEQEYKIDSTEQIRTEQDSTERNGIKRNG